MNENRPPFTEQDIQELWQEKYEFNRSELGLSDEKAREWADRGIRVLREFMEEFKGI